MRTQNSCYTYFKIVGDFNPDDITELLGLQPERTWKAGDARRNGTRYDFSLWEFGLCSEYDIEVENQMRKTISALLSKVDLLNQLRIEKGVELYLEVVPTIFANDQSPCLAPSLDIIDFCHATRTTIDIDMYVMDSANKEL